MVKRKYREYKDEDIVKIAAEVKSLGSLLKHLGLKVAGGNYAHMKKTLQRLDVNCSHWTGQGWNKDQQLKDWSEYNEIKYLKKHLIKERGHKCEKCGLEEWINNPIPLEVDHRDGDRTNNREENLILLCCNCHALTPTWRGKKNKKDVIKIYCKLCKKEISNQAKTGLCVSCFNKTRKY
jgi:hypothetical protein